MDEKNRLPSWSFSHEFSAGLLFFTLLFLCLGGCTSQQAIIFQPTPPFMFFDDGELESLKLAIQQQQHYLDAFREDDRIMVGEQTFTIARLTESLKTFREIIDLEPSPFELDRIIRENFTIFQAGGRRGSISNTMLITGYYEPILQGSLELAPPFIFPVYSPPADLIRRKNSNGENQAGRIDKDGKFQPYWTREEINNNNTARGYELAYLKDRFDVFLLHVQGSGKIQLRDGSLKSIQYSTNNGHSYSSIGKLLVDEKKMALKDVDIPAIRKYLLENQDDEQRVLNHNRRYIFFNWGEGKPIKGSIGEPLTPGRSVAIDQNTLPMGMIAYLVSQKPVVDEDGKIIRWYPLQRFVLPQDSGAAIKGAGRVDFFWGNGKYAELAAGSMKEKGYLYFLLKNDFELTGETSD